MRCLLGASKRICVTHHPLPSYIYIYTFPAKTGPLDVGTSVALPRRPIPEQYTKSLRQRVRHVTFASNPCRVRYFTQEIVLFREDLLKKMQRHLAVPLVLDDPNVPDITTQLVESLLDQAHLCPLPLHAKPVYWELDYALRLFPLPHLVSNAWVIRWFVLFVLKLCLV